jgi:hypothetical protein
MRDLGSNVRGEPDLIMICYLSVRGNSVRLDERVLDC